MLLVCSFSITLALFTLRSYPAPIPGHVISWGYDFNGQSTPPSDLNDVIAVAAGQAHNLALRANGTVVAWGDPNFASVPLGLSNVIAIATAFHSVALKSDGSVTVWNSPQPEINSIPPAATNITAIGTSPGAIVALRRDGTVIAWGSDARFTNIPPNLTGVVQFSVGQNHALARKSDGTVVAWGYNEFGQSTPPPDLGPVRSVEAGQTSSTVIKPDFTAFRWGGSFDSNDIPAGLTGVAAIETGNQHAIALRTNGTVAAWGYNFWGQGSVPEELTGVTAVAAGGNHNLVVTARPRLLSLTPPVDANLRQSVTINVSAAGGPLTYQWQHRGTNLPNQTNASLTISSVMPENAGQYTVVVSNSYGYIKPTTALNLPPPTISSQPVSREVHRTEPVTFSVTAAGLSPVTYQWYHNGTTTVGSNSSTLFLPAVDSPNVGTYHVVVTDGTGTSVQSANATLNIIDPRAKTVILTPTADTSISTDHLKPQGNSTLLVGRRGLRTGSDIDRALLRFDLTSIPTNAIVQSATLKLLVVRAPTSTPYNLYLHRMLKAWTTSATWSSADIGVPWASPGAAAGTDYLTNWAPGLVASDSNGFFGSFGGSTPLISDLQIWIQHPATNHGWMIISEGEKSDYSARHFASSETLTPPQLLLTYQTPAPIPTLTNSRIDNRTLRFTITPAPGWFYQIQTREHLDRGEWTILTNLPAGNASTPLSFQSPLTNTHRFFRTLRH